MSEAGVMRIIPNKPRNTLSQVWLRTIEFKVCSLLIAPFYFAVQYYTVPMPNQSSSMLS